MADYEDKVGRQIWRDTWDAPTDLYHGGKMTFEQWIDALGPLLDSAFGWETGEGAEYIQKSGAESWREMYDDGLSPDDAVSEEKWASM